MEWYKIHNELGELDSKPNIEELRKRLEDIFKKSVDEEKIHEDEKLSDSEK